LPFHSSDDAPPIQTRSKASVRSAPGSIASQASSASEATTSSTQTPAAPTAARRHLSGNAAASEAST
jgi:hypothetical protein